MDSYIELLKLVLPEFLIEHFELVRTQTLEETLHIYFEEKARIPEEFNHLQLVSKGFLNEITIQDFPLRGKHVYLHIKRRRWTNKLSGEILQRDWNLVAKGTRITSDFAAFLKDINRY
ncbi:ISAon1 family transposase N-terminal region protein [Flavobacterium adhaerens]|uniref:ISAon1 family transposase N-terminal region protein n=1 Tax=Flavobacterium adhaerens TaxID=3149043 RepID=UPI0032B43B08